MVVLSTVLYVMNLSFKPGMQYVTYIPFLIGVILNAVAFSKANDANVTYGNVFGSGFKMSALVTIIILVWSFISMMIFPEMATKGMELARQSMMEKNMSEEQIDKAMTFMESHFKLFMVIGVVFWTILFGAIFSLIGAAVAKKNGAKPQQTL
jgi:uncharacterized membrane protein YciS (DUF1049 family)